VVTKLVHLVYLTLSM